jgi:tetratricopeptide (TPR) repeat protein
MDKEAAEARRGLKRAKSLETVEGLIASGRKHEQKNDLSAAQSDYREALGLDPESDEAKKALDRISNAIDRRDFQKSMSAGFEAFHQGNYRAAQAAFLRAKNLRPDSLEVKDALAQVDQALGLARIDNLRERAVAAEKAENWKAALEAYSEVLKLDPTIQFAQLGRERSLDRIRLTRQINYYLAKPHVLESDRMLENAILVLEAAQGVEPKPPGLAGLVAKLDRLVTIARTPVRVTLESDNLTEVAVYKVGRLGRFSAHDLNLRPGTYTVVGTRDGYKDVRLQIAVEPGPQTLRVRVQCREKI